MGVRLIDLGARHLAYFRATLLSPQTMALTQLKGLARPAMAIGKSHSTARTAIGTKGLSIERVSALAPVTVVNDEPAVSFATVAIYQAAVTASMFGIGTLLVDSTVSGCVDLSSADDQDDVKPPKPQRQGALTEFFGKKPKPGRAHKKHRAGGRRSAAASSLHEDDSVEPLVLPDGWELRQSRIDGKHYYQNIFNTDEVAYT